MQVNSGDTMQGILERRAGRRAQLILDTGESLEGVLSVVGDQVVQLSELVGREFFEAVIRTDAVRAVIIRSESK